MIAAINKEADKLPGLGGTVQLPLLNQIRLPASQSRDALPQLPRASKSSGFCRELARNELIKPPSRKRVTLKRIGLKKLDKIFHGCAEVALDDPSL